MRQRRRLSDLYVRGKETEIDDGTGHPVKIWLQKLNGIDREACLRRGNAAKARFMVEADNEESDIYQSMYAQVRDMHDREGLIAIVIAEDLARYRQRVESELATDEGGWGKDNYIGGLVDSWIGDDDNPGLAAAHAEDGEDPEASRVLAEIERFEKQVAEQVRAEATRLEKEWTDVSDEDLWRRATHRVLEMRANEAFNTEFERQQLFYCVREPTSHDKRYFKTIQEIDDLDERVQKEVIKNYTKLMVDGNEGKDSPGSRPSSNSSVATPEAETEVDSGQEAVST